MGIKLSIQTSSIECTEQKTRKDDKSSLKIISWNINGGNRRYVSNRIQAIQEIILREDADVVFLQEVTDFAVDHFQRTLHEYRFMYEKQGCPYYTAILLKVSTVACKYYHVTPFEGSKMSRNLLSALVTVKDEELLLLTTHLESGRGNRVYERLSQLQTAFDKIARAEGKLTVIFGGDMNLNGGMVKSIGGIPKGIQDAWISCGRPKESRYTWDGTVNDNLGPASKKLPKRRFDRIYFRNSSRSMIFPEWCSLVGNERIREVGCFPSDHWGIMVNFQL